MISVKQVAVCTPGHAKANDPCSSVCFYLRLMTKQECVKLWRKKPMVLILKKRNSPEINYVSSEVRHLWTCIVCVWYWLPLYLQHMTPNWWVYSSLPLGSVRPWCTCEVVLAYPTYHDHSPTVMYQGTPTWIYCVSEFKKKKTKKITYGPIHNVNTYYSTKSIQ